MVTGVFPDEEAQNMPFRLNIFTTAESGSDAVIHEFKFIFDPTDKDVPGTYYYTISYFWAGASVEPFVRGDLEIVVLTEARTTNQESE